MECRSVVNSLSDYIDGRGMWLAGDEISELEKHLDTCTNCRSVKLDLSELKTAACELPLHTPKKALWNKIAEAVEAEFPKSERPTRVDGTRKNFLKELFSQKFSISFPQLASASAAVTLFFVFGVYSAYNKGVNVNPVNYVRDNLSGFQAALLPGEDVLKAELEKKLQNINIKKAQWHPIDRDSFEKELQNIESKLSTARDSIKKQPSEQAHKQLLSSLYDQKRRLLEDVERLNF